MHKVDIHKEYDWKIDAKCTKSVIEMPGEDQEFITIGSNPGCLHSLPSGDSRIVNIVGIGAYENDCRVEVFKYVLNVKKQSTQHLYTQKIHDLDDDCIQLLLTTEYYNNILIINDIDDVVRFPAIKQLRKNNYTSVLRMKPEEVDKAYQMLPMVDWIVIHGAKDLTTPVSTKIIPFLRLCEKKNIPFWFNDSINLEELTLEAEKAEGIMPAPVGSGGLSVDFPVLANHDLFDGRLNLGEGVSEIHDIVLKSKNNIAKSVLNLIVGLYKLDTYAHKRGKRVFWQSNFGVNNFSEYCERKVGISGNLGFQYLLAARVMARLNPPQFDEIIKSSTVSANFLGIGHTRFRDAAPLVPKLEQLRVSDEDRFKTAMADLSNLKISNRKAIESVRNQLPRDVVDIDVEKTTRRALRRIRAFSNKLREDIEPAKQDEFDNHINSIIELMQSDPSDVDRSIDGVDLGGSSAEYIDADIVEDRENISRETFLEEVEVDAPDPNLSDEENETGKPVDHYVAAKIKDGKWEEVTLGPEITGLKRPMEILTAPRGASFVKCAWHGDKDTFCPPIWADIALGSGACGFGCRTCFLMLTFRAMRDPSRPLVYTNYSKMDSDIQKWLLAKHYYYVNNDKRKIQKKRSYKETVGLGIDCADSLLFEGYTGNLRRLAPMFQSEKSNPLETQLILLTKSANTQYLDELKSSKNIIVTMSLNPEGIADLWEGKYADGVRITPPIKDRLVALRHAQDLGFEVRIRLDPILTPVGWEEQYREFVNEMFVLGIKPAFITLGTYREKNNQIDVWREKWGLLPAEIDSFSVGDKREGTHFHIKDRSQTYSTVETIIKKGYASGSFQPHTSLCKETFGIRKELGLTNPYCNCLRSEVQGSDAILSES